MLGIHHRCPYSTCSSVWVFSSYCVLKWRYVFIYIIKVWVWVECSSAKPIMGFKEMQNDIFPASSSQRGTSFNKEAQNLLKFCFRTAFTQVLIAKRTFQCKTYVTCDSLSFRLRFSSKTMSYPTKIRGEPPTSRTSQQPCCEPLWTTSQWLTLQVIINIRNVR